MRLRAGVLLVAFALMALPLVSTRGQTAGSPHPTQPHVIRQGNGWIPEEGYRWVNKAAAVAGRDLAVAPVADGTPHERYPNVVWTGNGKLRAAPGFHFVNLNAPGEDRVKVERTVGSPHPTQQNVVWQGTGWIPANGYRWLDTAAAVAGKDLRAEPVPDGTPHESFPNIVWTGDGKLRPAAGFRFVAPNVANDYRVERIPGAVHPTQQNVTWKGGTWVPNEGFRWVNASAASAGKDLRVEPVPDGTPHERFADVVWTSDRRLRPVTGFRWVNLQAPGDERFKVERIPGSPHPTAANVVWQVAGWTPAEGYTWVNPAAQNDLTVRRVPDGTPHERYPDVVWTADGRLRPVAGYRFINLDAPGEERVKVERIPGSAHPTVANVVWGGKGWVPVEGYTWVNPAAKDDLTVLRVADGTPHERYQNVLWTGDGMLRPAPGYRFKNRNAAGDERFLVEPDSGAAAPVVAASLADLEIEVADLPQLQPGWTIVGVSTVGDSPITLRPEIRGGHVLLRGDERGQQSLLRLNGLQQLVATARDSANRTIVIPIYFWVQNKRLQKYSDDYISGKSYAVIVAAGNYHSKDPNKPDLTQATKQARELGKVLEGLGFETKYFLDDEVTLDKDAIDRYLLAELNPKLDPQRDRVFFYFGGHGASDYDYTTRNKTGYLLLPNYDPKRLYATAISMQDDVIHRWSSNIRAKHVFFAIDACVASIGMRSVTMPTPEQYRQIQTLATIKATTDQPGRTILTAGTDGEGAIDVNGGIFTSELIKGLKTDLFGDGVITISELELEVTTRVRQYAAYLGKTQTPYRVDLPDKRGEMIFLLAHH